MPGHKIGGMRLWPAELVGIAVAFLTAFPPDALANDESAQLRHRGETELYSLDNQQALATFREATAADPQDAAAYRALATAIWIDVGLARGTLTADNYLGTITRNNIALPPPPAHVAAEFNQAIDHAVALARTRLADRPRDVDAHYELGAAIGLRASYIATVDGSLLKAFRAAREAYDAHETVLKLDPSRQDAGLIVGTYRYLIATLSLPLRWAAYMAGFGGGREKGLQLVERSASYPGANQPDARLALSVLLNREGRYVEALAQLAKLRAEFPRNRLLWLETGSTLLRAARAAEADQFLSEGIGHLATDRRTRMFGEEALWFYKRGAARAALGRGVEADDDLRRSIDFEGRGWVHGRAQFALGQLAAKRGDRVATRGYLEAAIRLCESDRDAQTAEQARQWLKNVSK